MSNEVLEFTPPAGKKGYSFGLTGVRVKDGVEFEYTETFHAKPLIGKRTRQIVPIILQQILQIADTQEGHELQAMLFTDNPEDSLQAIFSNGTPQRRLELIRKIVQVAAPVLAFMEDQGLAALSTVTQSQLEELGKPEEIIAASIGLVVHHITRIMGDQNFESVQQAVGKSSTETMEPEQQQLPSQENVD